MKLFKKIVDEREERDMIRTERGAFWAIVTALGAVMLIQLALGFELRAIAGEMISLYVGAIWVIAGNIRRGTWDYFTRPGIVAYFGYSAGCGVAFAIISVLVVRFRFGFSATICVILSLVTFTLVFAICFLGLFIFGTLTKWQQKRMRDKYGDDGKDG